MSSLFINYASQGFEPYQTISTITARRMGFDDCRAYSPSDLAPSFVAAHEAILTASRGAGYWLWKPYVVARALREIEEGDHLFYADAAVHFVNPITPMIERMEELRLDLLVLGEGFTEAEYTKRDAFVLMECDAPRFVQTPQRFASYFMLRKCSWAEDFVESYLRYASDARILTDSPNATGAPNHPGFVAHRHDQSVFSLLTKKLGVPVFETGFVREGLAARENQILNHTRTHVSPGKILQHLLAEGVLRPEHLREIELRSRA